jgi:hypothetical protein
MRPAPDTRDQQGLAIKGGEEFLTWRANGRESVLQIRTPNTN